MTITCFLLENIARILTLRLNIGATPTSFRGASEISTKIESTTPAKIGDALR